MLKTRQQIQHRDTHTHERERYNYAPARNTQTHTPDKTAGRWFVIGQILEDGLTFY